MRKIPFFNYPLLYQSRKTDFDRIFADVCSRGAFIMQKDMCDFEDSLRAFTGVNYALGVANGTDAIWLALIAQGIKPGDEVILSSHTYIATAGAVRFVGAIPVPVDIDLDNMISASAVEAAITERTKLILITQVNGRQCDMDALISISEKRNIPILEDAAQGLGSRYNGQHIGSRTLGATISFYPAKNLGSFGDAGAFITNDKSLYDKVKLLRDHGRNDEGIFETWGFNSRLDNLQAAILNFKLTYYEEEIEIRRSLAKRYIDNLKNLDHYLKLPDSFEDPKYFDVFQNFECEFLERDGLKSYLAEQGVGTLIQWSGQPLHRIKTLDMKFIDNGYERCEKFFDECLMLPMNTTLSSSDIDYISEKIILFYDKFNV